MMNRKELLLTGEEILRQSGIAEFKIDAWYLMEHCLHLDRVSFWLNQEEPVSVVEEENYLCAIKKRGTHIPLQHITGWQEFMGISFQVNEHVLIPRQDTECLVEAVLSLAKDKEVLDMCTGSGCIAISLALLSKPQSVTGVDLSLEALAVASENGKRLGAGVNWLISNLFETVTGKYDIIVSNPPYIEPDEIESLMPEVSMYEPRMALYGGADGLMFYRSIIKEAAGYLKPEGWLFFEIGCSQAAAVSDMLARAGYHDIQVKKDLSGKDRIVCGKKISGIRI